MAKTKPLGKTATKMLARIQANRFHMTTVEWGVEHRTPYGARERNAASELRKAGLVTVESDGSQMICLGRGKMAHTYSWRVTLVEVK